MTEVSLSEILDAREMRAKLQKKLSEKYHSTLISFTMNIAGPVKNSPLITRAFSIGVSELEAYLPEDKILYSQIESENPTGPFAIYAVNEDAYRVKKICVGIEEKTALGRLFDIDVIDKNLKKLNRDSERGCIVCNASGRACAAGRLHPVSEIQGVMRRIMTDGVFRRDAERIASLAVQALIKEVKTTPKPGLVDLRNNGSHPDMSVEIFEKSAVSLEGYFLESIETGRKYADETYDKLFSELRRAGILAEKNMYDVTGGVNTHKGAIFSFGILCGGIGRLWTPECPVADSCKIFDTAAKIARIALESDLASPVGTTAGERMFIKHGVAGIRGEAASGFPSVSKLALPIYQSLLGCGLSDNHSGVITLLNLIASIDDTTLYKRGGMAGLSFAKEYAGRLIKENPQPEINQVEDMDDEFIKRNLSAGGAADLLAVTYFIDSLYEE